jgi:DNA-binding HxlR family transcriptional regulator
LDDRETFARSAQPVWRFPQPLKALAQALSPSVAIDSVQSGRRIVGRASRTNSARGSGSTYPEQNAFDFSSIDRAKIVSSAEAALCLVRGKWKIPILSAMLYGPVRLGELRRLIPRASKKVLVEQLHALEKDGIIVRTDFSGKIKHVEYAISAPLGDQVVNLLQLLSNWGLRNAQEMAVAGRTPVPRVPTEWSTPSKSVDKICTGGVPKRSSKDFRVIIGLGE